MTYVSGYRIIFDVLKLEQTYNSILWNTINLKRMNEYEKSEYDQKIPQSHTADQLLSP